MLQKWMFFLNKIIDEKFFIEINSTKLFLSYLAT